MRAWERARRAPATIFMARVIFCVDLTLPMRLRIVFSEGMAGSYFLSFSPLPNTPLNSSRALRSSASRSLSRFFLVRIPS